MVNVVGQMVYRPATGAGHPDGQLRNYLMFLAVALVGLFAGSSPGSAAEPIRHDRAATCRRASAETRIDHQRIRSGPPGSRPPDHGTGDRAMSDNLLLTSLWLLPLIGMAVVLAVPRRSEASIKYVSLGFTVATFVAPLIALRQYLGDDEVAASPLQTRAAQNIAPGRTGQRAAVGRRRVEGRRTTWSSAGLDPLLQHPVFPRAGRHQPQPGRPDRAGERPGLPGVVEHRRSRSRATSPCSCC